MTDTAPSPRVLLVDDHEIYRAGLRGLLEEAGIDIVGEASHGEAALDLVEEKHPNVVIMDLNMPGIGGIEATRQITTIAPLTRVIMLTVSSAAPDITDAVLAGACGYLLKSATTQEIVSGIAAASRGDALLSPSVAAKLLERVRETPVRPAVPDPASASLTEREIEVLRLLSSGMDNAEIGRTLFISPSTVKNHISSILLKLQIENRIQAAVYAVRSGLV
ncbi:MAG TPA: response regulator transcription factor [Thermoleophilaceae bacterium]|nr:response regulator transcription factor [Thermoleophilaceae bacterium]